MLTDETRFRWLGYLSILKGLRYKLSCRLFRGNVKIGGNFKLVGDIAVKGTGRVILGDGCSLRERNSARTKRVAPIQLVSPITIMML